MNKKKTALIIQISLVLALGVIIFSTYKAIQNDQSLTSETETVPTIQDAACPTMAKRTCCYVSYCTKVQECPPLPLECNSQNDLKFCFQYSWKNIPKGRPGMCNYCNSANIDTITYKVSRECIQKK